MNELEAKRDLFEHFFAAGYDLEKSLEEADVQREWRVLAREPDRAILVTGGDIVGVVGVDGNGTITSAQLHAAGDSLLDQYAYRVLPEIRANADKVSLGSFVRVYAARVIGAGAGQNVIPLAAPVGKRRYTWDWGAVLEVDVHPGDIARASRFFEGEEAKAMRRERLASAFERESMRRAVVGRLPARTVAEAAVYLDGMKAVWMHEGRDENAITVFTETPEGPRAFEFSLASEERTADADLGDGTSSILDAADFILRAGALVQGLPDRDAATPQARVDAGRRLRLAAACLRQALAFIPEGQEGVPVAGPWQTSAGSAMRAAEPARFTRAALTAGIRRLEGLDAAGFGGSGARPERD